MTAGPVNQALLQSFYQNAGDVYDDNDTEGAFGTLSNQIDDNWFSLAATQATVSGLLNNNSIIQTTNFLGRQMVINGDFDIWQRGAVFSNIGLTPSYTADRWLAYRSPAAAGMRVSRTVTTQINQQTFIPTVGREIGDTSLSEVIIAQALDSDTSAKFRGGKVTLRFQARALFLADFSAANEQIRVKLAYGTGQNQNAAGVITGYTEVVNQLITMTGAFQTFTFTTPANLPSNISQLFIYFSYVPTGVPVNANDNFSISQVQLSATSSALAFQPRAFMDELIDCMRYTVAMNDGSVQGVMGLGFANTTTSAPIFVPLPVQMRIEPTLVATATDWQLSDGVTNTDLTVIGTSTTNGHNLGVLIICTVAAGLTQFRPYRLQADNTAGRLLIFDAEF